MYNVCMDILNVCRRCRYWDTLDGWHEEAVAVADTVISEPSLWRDVMKW